MWDRCLDDDDLSARHADRAWNYWLEQADLATTRLGVHPYGEKVTEDAWNYYWLAFRRMRVWARILGIRQAPTYDHEGEGP